MDEEIIKTLKEMKVSTLVFWLIVIISVLLVFVGTRQSPNVQVMTIFSDLLKVLAGALAGALAGERKK